MMEGGTVVECPNDKCKAAFIFEPAKINYAAKDDTGKTVTRQTAEHMAKFRVRCATCCENFCTSCKIMPYHQNYTCEEAKTKKAAVKCRFCWDMMD